MKQIDWSSGQREALQRISDWLRSGTKPFFYLGGYAGTGKSTLASEIAHYVDNAVVYAAFTGKAALVMQSKGCTNASTVDRLIYAHKVEKRCTRNPSCAVPCADQCQFLHEKLIGRTLNRSSKISKSRLVIIDEVSMVDKDMAKDLLSFRIPVLTLGDPAQLPPPQGLGYFTNREPDCFLTEVHRQALDSPVIYMASQARDGNRLHYGVYRDSSVIRYRAQPLTIIIDGLLDVDQIIVGTHKMRCDVNNAVRHALGFSGGIPQPGERLVCLKNNHQNGLRNGSIVTVVAIKNDAKGFLDLVVEDYDGRKLEITAPVAGFGIADGSGNELPETPLTYAYALTCHKAQGSEWKSVAVFDEGPCFREQRWCWLYTAITRASERVTVVA
jgi:exodeoxyribonuclease-5